MPLKKNTSSECKDTQLLTIFKAHFSGYLQLQRVRLICMIIKALCESRSVNFSKLSSGFDNQIESSSNYRRIQRFFAQVELPMELVAKLIFGLLPNKESLVLVLDRTNWKLGQTNRNVTGSSFYYFGRKKQHKNYNLFQLIVVFSMVFLLNIISNYFIIITLIIFECIEDNAFHQFIGWISFIIYQIIPTFLLIKYAIRPKLALQNYTFKTHKYLFFIVSILILITSISLKKEKKYNLLYHLPQNIKMELG